MGYHNVTQLLPAGITTGSRMPLRNLLRRNHSDEAKLLPIPGFRRRKLPGEHRHKFVSRLANHPSATICGSGLTFLFTYTWSKAMSDAGDLLNGTNADALRAVAIPGLGPKFDYSLSDFDLRQVVHFSGGYELPFGKDKQFMNHGWPCRPDLGRLVYQLDPDLARRTAPRLWLPYRHRLGPGLQRHSWFPARTRNWASRSRAQAAFMIPSGSETRRPSHKRARCTYQREERCHNSNPIPPQQIAFR